MRTALCCALLSLAAGAAGAQEREVTFEAPKPVAVTGFAVGLFSWDREQAANSALASKLAVSLFQAWSDNLYLFGQLTTRVAPGDSGATTTEIEVDNLIVSWTPPGASALNVSFGRFDAPLGFERDDEPLNLIPTNSFNFGLARPSKLTGVAARFTAGPSLELVAAAANGWNVAVDNNRDKTGLLRAQWIARPGLTIGVTGLYGPERDSTSGQARALVSSDVTLEVGRLIAGAELNAGRERAPAGAALTWTGVAATGFLRLGSDWGLTARYEYLDDRDGVLGAGTILQSLTAGPMWFFRSAQEGIFSNIEHTTFHLPQVAVRTAVRLDSARRPFFEDAGGALQRTDTRAVVELVFLF